MDNLLHLIRYLQGLLKARYCYTLFCLSQIAHKPHHEAYRWRCAFQSTPYEEKYFSDWPTLLKNFKHCIFFMNYWKTVCLVAILWKILLVIAAFSNFKHEKAKQQMLLVKCDVNFEYRKSGSCILATLESQSLRYCNQNDFAGYLKVPLKLTIESKKNWSIKVVERLVQK